VEWSGGIGGVEWRDRWSGVRVGKEPRVSEIGPRLSEEEKREREEEEEEKHNTHSHNNAIVGHNNNKNKTHTKKQTNNVNGPRSLQTEYLRTGIRV